MLYAIVFFTLKDTDTHTHTHTHTHSATSCGIDISVHPQNIYIGAHYAIITCEHEPDLAFNSFNHPSGATLTFDIAPKYRIKNINGRAELTIQPIAVTDREATRAISVTSKTSLAPGSWRLRSSIRLSFALRMIYGIMPLVETASLWSVLQRTMTFYGGARDNRTQRST